MDLVVIDPEGEVRVVKVDRGVAGYEVRVDEETFVVNHVAAGGSHRSLLIDGRQQEVSVQVDPKTTGTYRISTTLGEETLVVRDPLDHLLQTTRGGSAVAGPTKVLALMPGRVVALLAGEGDTVTAGQGIVVLEAMKMENEIQTEVAGVVKSIFVGTDQAVDSGDPLFEIEPD